MNIAPIKKCSIKKSDGKPLFQSGKKSKVEKKLYIKINLLVFTMADRDQKYGHF